jgi:CO/xanthine dehydrogenase FAD-binding subunit
MAEKVLTNREITEALAEEAGRVAGTVCIPITDVRASREYRCGMVEVLTKRSVMEAFSRSKNGTLIR